MRDGKEGLKKKKKETGNHFSALHTTKSLTEIERLQLEILKRDIEIARLKKGYQVKGVGVNKAFVTLKDKNSK
ncbi:ArsR family transcriptional regulator [Erysipelothrix sp. Poltava]|nr:ArsR family transcriptional regulator [Erysipelothrix sp. Poltava]